MELEESGNTPPLVESPALEKLEIKCCICNEEFIHETALKIHEMFHSKDSYCFVCKRTISKNFHEHIKNRHVNHTCKTCGKVFTLKKILDSHCRTHTKDRKFKCDKCEKSFMGKATLSSHITSTHQGIKPFVCKICKGTFTTSSSLKKHLRKMHTQSNYECRVCFEKFSDKKEKFDHEREHTRSKECKFCLKKYTETANLARHLMLAHYKTEKCIHCEKMFHKSVLDAHVAQQHKPRECPICKMTFYLARALRAHLLTHEEKVTCELCKRSHLKINTEKHLQLHRENKVMKCKLCWRICFDIDKHNAHVHKNRTYSYCMWCPKKFHTAQSRNKHVIQVHSQEIGRHQCSFCGKRFIQLASLTKHIDQHFQLRPYKCFICRRGFKYLHRLKKHNDTHDDKKEYKFKCPVCDTKYCDKYYFKKHLIMYHSPTILSDDSTELEKSTVTKINFLQNSGRKLQCKKCRALFKYSSSFKKHFCTAQSTHMYLCSFCPKRYKMKTDLVQHLEEEHPNNKLKCNICGFMFINKVGIRKHMRMHMLNKNKKKSAECDKEILPEKEVKPTIEDIKMVNMDVKCYTEDASVKQETTTNDD